MHVAAYAALKLESTKYKQEKWIKEKSLKLHCLADMKHCKYKEQLQLCLYSTKVLVTQFCFVILTFYV